jgi:hypothetical protein
MPDHPALAGREQESAALADAVRRLAGLSVTTTAPVEATLAAARKLQEIADELERHSSDPSVSRTLVPEWAGADDPAVAEGLADGGLDLAGRMPFDVIVGRHNPLALPLTVSFDPPKALLAGTFTRQYEGPPNCVHGAVLAASFDVVLAVANVIAGVPGPTAKLAITYRRPTVLYEPCLFEGVTQSHDARRVRAVGRLIQRGQVTVEAVGEYAKLDRAAIVRMAERAQAAGGGPPA